MFSFLFFPCRSSQGERATNQGGLAAECGLSATSRDGHAPGSIAHTSQERSCVCTGHDGAVYSAYDEMEGHSIRIYILSTKFLTAPPVHLKLQHRSILQCNTFYLLTLVFIQERHQKEMGDLLSSNSASLDQLRQQMRVEAQQREEQSRASRQRQTLEHR